MGSRFLLLIFSSLLLFGCGPEQTARDAETEQRDEFVAKEKARLEQFEGCYTGTAFYGGKNNAVILTLMSFSNPVVNPSSSEVIEIPFLIGALEQDISLTTIGVFDIGLYSTVDNTLWLKSQTTGSALAVVPQNSKTGNRYRLVGKFIGFGKVFGDIDVTFKQAQCTRISVPSRE